MKKNNINKSKLKSIIYNEVCDGNWETIEELHKNLVDLLSTELENYIEIDSFIAELNESGTFKHIKVNENDLKKITTDNLINKIVINNNKVIEKNYNLLPLLNTEFNAIKQEDYYSTINNLESQVKGVISNPLDKKISGVVELAFADGEVFDSLIQDEKSYMEEVRKGNDVNSRSIINYCKKNSAIYEEYRKEENLNVLINDIKKSIKGKNINYIIETIEYILIEYIDELSKTTNLSMNDVEDVINSNSYKKVLSKVPYDEFISLIQDTSELKYKKNSLDNVKTKIK